MPLGDVRLGVGVLLVGAGGMGNDGGVELAGELAAKGGDATSESRAIFLASALVVDGFDGLAKLVGEIFDERVEFAFELFGASLLFGTAFDFEAGAFAGELALALLERLALDGCGGELIVELVEEGSDVGGLSGELSRGRRR